MIPKYARKQKKERSRLYYLKNKDLLSIKIAIYQKNNSEHLKQKAKEWQLKNKNRVKKLRKIYILKNKQKIRDYHKKWSLLHREQQAKYKKEWAEKNRARINRWDREKRKSDPLYKLSKNIRCRIREGIKNNNLIKKDLTETMLNCTFKELKIYLELKFKRGMSWSNYGKGGWHIDHIKPLATAKTEADIIRLNHYTNLQPLWAEENLRKARKYL